jgi:hypothetical protein
MEEKSMKGKLIHIKSKQRGADNDTPKLPTSNQLQYGEIAINYGDGIETIAIRNENDEIVKFISEKKIHEYVEKRVQEAMGEVLKKMEHTFLPDDNVSIDSGEY